MNDRSLLAATVAFVALAAPAEAQTKYFARERISGAAAATTAPASSCDAFVATTYVYDGQVTNLGAASSESAAAALCVARMKIDKKSGYCRWDPRTTSSTPHVVTFHANATDIYKANWISHSAAKCTAR